MIDLEKTKSLYDRIAWHKVLICVSYLTIIVSCAVHEFVAVPGILLLLISMERIRTLHVEAEYSFNHDLSLDDKDRLRIMLSWLSTGINVPIAYLNISTMLSRIGVDSEELRKNVTSLVGTTSSREVYTMFLVIMCVSVSVVMLIIHLITPNPIGLVYAAVLGIIHSNIPFIKDSFLGSTITFLYCTDKEKYEDEIHKYVRKQYKTYSRD